MIALSLDDVLAGVELAPLVFDQSRAGCLFGGDPEVLRSEASTWRRDRDRERSRAGVAHRGTDGSQLHAAPQRRGHAGQRLCPRGRSHTMPGARHTQDHSRASPFGKDGGGCEAGVKNHRAGLYDAILIKNNHITAAGGVAASLERTRGTEVLVEIEVRTRAELDEALDWGAKHLLLDNLTPAEAKEWIAHIGGRATVELSGGITLSTARAYAETGADYLSSGAITHSAPAVDINFRMELKP